MAKSKKKPATKPAPARPSSKKKTIDVLKSLNENRTGYIFLGVILVLLIILYKPLVFDGLTVNGVDVVSNIGNTKQIGTFKEETGQRALWNPYIFAGMPIYHRHGPITWSIDSLLNETTLGMILDWQLLYLWLGALGMFLLVKYLGLGGPAALFAAASFVLIPHMQALITVGHFAKLRALMWMPLVAVAFLWFLNRRNWLSILAFAAAFALQLRTQHYQIVFYTIMLLFALGITPLVRSIMDKDWPKTGSLVGRFVVGMALVVAIVAQPLFVTYDYTPHSIRGGNSVSISDNVDALDQKGAGFDYATRWSYTVAEFWNLIIPRFHGGTSTEIYTGDAVPQFRNQAVPLYWGDLPFTQSLEYLGVLAVFLALCGIVFHWHRTEVRALLALTILALILSLGSHFPAPYRFFFNYVPQFDKFRVPMMILTLVSFTLTLLAAYGFNFFLRGNWSDSNIQKRFYLLAGGYALLLLIPIFFGSSFSLSTSGELQRYTAQYGNRASEVVGLLKQARLEVLTDSAWRSVIFFLIGGGLLLAVSREMLSKFAVALLIPVLAIADVGLVSWNFLDGKFENTTGLEARQYRMNRLDQIVKQDQEIFRVLPPLRTMARDSRFPYFYQSIGGYDPAKTQVIQDLIENNLFQPTKRGIAFNTNIVNMLNGKYIFSSQPYSDSSLTLLGDEQKQLFLYRNNDVLPRAYFVDEVKVFESRPEMLRFMNTTEFDPSRTALMEAAPAGAITPAAGNSTVKVNTWEPDKLVIETSNSQQSLLVVSEIYYPNGWSATLENGTELPIYKTNHALRSVVVPAGSQKITMAFEPGTYSRGVTISWIGWLLTYAGLAFFGYMEYQRRNDKEDES